MRFYININIEKLLGPIQGSRNTARYIWHSGHTLEATKEVIFSFPWVEIDADK